MKFEELKIGEGKFECEVEARRVLFAEIGAPLESRFRLVASIDRQEPAIEPVAEVGADIEVDIFPEVEAEVEAELEVLPGAEVDI